MKLTEQLNPKRLFSKSNKKTRSSLVSKTDQFSSGSSNSSIGSGLLLTPKSVLPEKSISHEIIKLSDHDIIDHDIPNVSQSISHDILNLKISNDDNLNDEIEQAFKLIDKDGDGKITIAEMEAVLSRVNGAEPMSQAELTAMLTEIDIDGDGCISLEEFGLIGSAFEKPACETELRGVFDFFDADKNGKISAEELLGVFKGVFGEDECTLEDCERMISAVDIDCDGFVCFNEFSKLMEQQRL